MPSFITLLIFFISLTFLAGGYYLSSSFYFKKFDVKYSFKRMFPYEVNYPNAFRNNIYGNIAFVIGLVGIIAFYIYSTIFVGKAEVTLVVLSVVSFLMAGFIAALLFLPLQFLRLHMIISTCAMVFAFAIPALEVCYIYPIFRNMVEGNKVPYIVAMIVGLVLSLTMLIFILNPRATYKIYLDKGVDKDGNETVTRPKFIPMAFNEWWAIITYFLSPIPFVIFSFMI